jgi:raffinose/stachyose/melibiose transport system permease protein
MPRAIGKPPRQKWGSPVTYFIALLFIAVCLIPVLYIILGGFRSNSQITSSPAGFPSPRRFDN